MLRRWMVVAAAVALVVGASADVGAGERASFPAPGGKVPPGFVNCNTPDGALKVKNQPKRNIFFLATAPGQELDSFRFTAFKNKKKKQRYVEVGIDSMPFGTLSFPFEVAADRILSFGYFRRDLKTGLATGSWAMDAGSSVHVTLDGFNAKKRRLWGRFSAENLADQIGGLGPADISGGEFNIKQELPPK